MLTIFLILGLTAFILSIVHAMGKCPLWPGVLVLAVAEMLRALPLGR
jgi:hypothetical protein